MAEEKLGQFGEFGGSYVPEGLQEVLDRLADDFYKISQEADFIDEFNYYLKEFVGRESPLTLAENLTKKLVAQKST